MTSEVSIPRQASVWDDSRNTSMVIQPSPNAVSEALAALAAFRRAAPEHVRWIEEGHPPLSDEEHVSLFGTPYVSHRKRGTQTRQTKGAA